MSADGPLDEMREALQGVLRGAAERVDLEGLKQSLEEMVAGGEDPAALAAEVTSAVPLADAERQTLESRLHGEFGEELPIRYKVRPSILGGLIVRVGDRYVDGSVAARLGRLREELMGSGSR